MRPSHTVAWMARFASAMTPAFNTQQVIFDVVGRYFFNAGVKL